jgi:hypothetical protein
MEIAKLPATSSTGWVDLPDELKLKVLKFALVDGNDVDSQRFKEIVDTDLAPFLEIP